MKLTQFTLMVCSLVFLCSEGLTAYVITDVDRSPDGKLLAFSYSQALHPDHIDRDILVQDVKTGQLKYKLRLQGGALYSPEFSADGSKLFVIANCIPSDCEIANLLGSRVLAINLNTGSYKILTDDGYDKQIIDFGYVELSAGNEMKPAPIFRTKPTLMAGQNRLLFLAKGHSPRDVHKAKDFMVTQLDLKTNQESFVSYPVGSSVPLSFRGLGNIEPFGPDKFILMGGPRRDLYEDQSRDEKQVLHIFDSQNEVLVSWTTHAFDKLGASVGVPAHQTLVGNADIHRAFVASKNTIFEINYAPSVPLVDNYANNSLSIFAHYNYDKAKISYMDLSVGASELLVVRKVTRRKDFVYDYLILDTMTGEVILGPMSFKVGSAREEILIK